MNEILKITTEFYKEKFRQEEFNDFTPFQGEPRTLNTEITQEEVKKAIKKLNNNRATGTDKISSEMLKYGTDNISLNIANIINDMFRTHQPLNINNGILLSLQKPG